MVFGGGQHVAARCQELDQCEVDGVLHGGVVVVHEALEQLFDLHAYPRVELHPVPP